MENVCLSLLPAGGKKTKYFYQTDCTDKNGAFRFDRIPAGTYVVVKEEGKITADEPFGTFYYPNAVRREEAAEITVGAGDFYDNLLVNAPQTAETITITGVLSFADGKPAADDSIEFFAETEEKKPRGDFDEDARAATDAFDLRYYPGSIPICAAENRQ